MDKALPFVARSDVKRRARLTLIAHMLGRLHYETMQRFEARLPERQKAGGYQALGRTFRYVAQKF